MYICIYVSLQFVIVCNLTFTHWTITDVLIGSCFFFELGTSILSSNKRHGVQIPPTPKKNWCLNPMIESNYHRVDAISLNYILCLKRYSSFPQLMLR